MALHYTFLLLVSSFAALEETSEEKLEWSEHKLEEEEEAQEEEHVSSNSDFIKPQNLGLST